MARPNNVVGEQINHLDTTLSLIGGIDNQALSVMENSNTCLFGFRIGCRIK
jgi:hypothetical protein